MGGWLVAFLCSTGVTGVPMAGIPNQENAERTLKKIETTLLGARSFTADYKFESSWLDNGHGSIAVKDGNKVRATFTSKHTGSAGLTICDGKTLLRRAGSGKTLLNRRRGNGVVFSQRYDVLDHWSVPDDYGKRIRTVFIRGGVWPCLTRHYTTDKAELFHGLETEFKAQDLKVDSLKMDRSTLTRIVSGMR